ncbi:MAG TPA: M24 family metallopeptidase, partial [Candidatus Hydrogenedentes bacterium]|nr:M24 family metallopeptidase [Candidatus Hydrogenedentota bacterium]
MIAIRTEQEIEVLRQANRIVAEVLVALVGMIKPGVKTRDLDAAAEDMLRERGACPAFKGYRGYP